MTPPPRGYFVTGTDTDVGKTVVSAVLLLGLDGRYWKPVQAGTHEPTDTDRVREWTGLPADRFLPEAYRLREAMSPHAAAELEGIEVEMERLVPPGAERDGTPAATGAPGADHRPLVVEGAGGLLVPLAPAALVIDLARRLAESHDLQAVLVARTSLGTLNHTLLSIEALRARRIPLRGVVLNGEEHESNRRTIERYGEVEVLGRIPPLPRIHRAALLEAFAGLALP